MSGGQQRIQSEWKWKKAHVKTSRTRRRRRRNRGEETIRKHRTVLVHQAYRHGPLTDVLVGCRNELMIDVGLLSFSRHEKMQ